MPSSWLPPWCASYTEVSPSLTGLKVWVRAALPPGKHKKTGERQLELYDRRRYFCSTGQMLPQFPTTVENRQAEVEALIAAEFPRKTHTQAPAFPLRRGYAP